jgi:hypothetical protein
MTPLLGKYEWLKYRSKFQIYTYKLRVRKEIRNNIKFTDSRNDVQYYRATNVSSSKSILISLCSLSRHVTSAVGYLANYVFMRNENVVIIYQRFPSIKKQRCNEYRGLPQKKQTLSENPYLQRKWMRTNDVCNNGRTFIKVCFRTTRHKSVTHQFAAMRR